MRCWQTQRGWAPARGNVLELLRFTVLTPVATLLEATGVQWIQVRLADGAGLGIFPGHAPLLAETVPAQVRYMDATGEHVLVLDAGILRIAASGVTLFTSGTVDEVPATAYVDVGAGPQFERLARELRPPARKRRRRDHVPDGKSVDD